MHNLKKRAGVLKKRSESEEEYRKILAEDLTKLQNELAQNSVPSPRVFAYPFGNVNNLAKEVIESFGFKITLSSQEGMNYIDSPADLLNMRRYNRAGRGDSESFIKKLELE
jgi:sugar-specific transcriptional regulator TrmB